MTYTDLISHLTELGASSPESEAAELTRVFSGKSREWCILNRTAELPNSSLIENALDKRRQGTPLQYIIGEAWFFGNRFLVTPDCLIPQPDTEHLVDLALKHAKGQCTVLDLCTGSGCVAISILKENPQACAVAVDISVPALEVAEKNASLHSCTDRIRLRQLDVFGDSTADLIRSADVIVSNPPYINSDVIPTLSSEVRCEPTLALDGGSDGLRFYRHFILTLTNHMKDGAVMLLEIGYDQSEPITNLCRSAGLTLKLHRDFGGNLRVAEITHVKPTH